MIQFDGHMFQIGLVQPATKILSAGEEMVIPNGGALNRNMVPLTPSGLMSPAGRFVWWFFFRLEEIEQQQKTNRVVFTKEKIFWRSSFA